MMRSMYSGVAGLKTHQTKMDVIGNNIANVNTVAYKSQSVTFSELMYQTTQAASGANAATGRGGVNARQIGLGSKTGAINTAISTQGASQTTNNPFDIRITGSAFFVVSDGSNTFFTRDGSFYVDGLGNLAMTSNGYNVMGWGVDPSNGKIKQDTVKALRIMSNENLTYPPEATSKATVAGIIDKNDTNISSSSGKALNLLFYDNLGYAYTAKFSIHESTTEGDYIVQLDDIIDANNNSIASELGVNNIADIATFGDSGITETTEIRELIKGVTYDLSNASAPKFIQEVTMSKVFGDYDKNKLNGVTYTLKNTASPQTLTAGASVDTVGIGTVSQEALEANEKAKLIFDSTKGQYYYEDSYGGGAGGGVVAKYLDNTNTTDWTTALANLGINNLKTVKVNSDGSVDFEFEQSFTVGDVDVNYDTGKFSKEITAAEAYGLDTSDPLKTYTFEVVGDEGTDGTKKDGTPSAKITTRTTYSGNMLRFDTNTGEFKGINGSDAVNLVFNKSVANREGSTVQLQNFSDISIDFSGTTMYNNSGTSTVTASNGDTNKLNAGRKLGQMSGVTIQNDGRIYASYDNGMSRLLGQIAVADFANASGLQKEGDNLYSASQNSGDFDGIGVEVTAGGGYMTTGVLEMSNVDLSAEFTEMITTQRGFQANSRIITTSDSLLEELVNLKR